MYNSFGFRAPRLWNKLPREVNLSETLPGFKANLGAFMKEFHDRPSVRGYVTVPNEFREAERKSVVWSCLCCFSLTLFMFWIRDFVNRQFDKGGPTRWEFLHFMFVIVCNLFELELELELAKTVEWFKVQWFKVQWFKVQLVHSLIHSRIDYCNGLLIGADRSDIACLQKVPNAATRFIFGRWQWRGVTELRRQLHFLPVTARIDYKICLMVFKCINNLSPSYLQSLIQRRQPKCKSLRHDDDPTLLQRDFSTKYKTSQRAFQVAGPRLWNILPETIRSCTDESLFKSRRKTHLFDKSYGPAG